MPAIITHHIFGEDVLGTLPAGMVEGEEEVLAFLLGNQGPDPLFARFSTVPSVAVRCRRLGHAMHDGRVVEAAFAMRDGVSHLPVADERVGRAFALGALGHYALDRTAHPFVFAQQEALAAAEASLAGAGSELHAVIESDIDSWILWEKRRATVLDRPAADNLMRTERIDRVAGALLSQVAYAAFGVELAAEEYAGCSADYELEYRLIDPAEKPLTRVVGVVERLVRPHSFAQSMAHRVVRTCDCPAANLARCEWRDPQTGRVRHESMADLFDEAAQPRGGARGRCQLQRTRGRGVAGGDAPQLACEIGRRGHADRPISHANGGAGKKRMARRDEPLDPQEGRGLVFFAVVAGAQVLDGGVRGIREGLQPGAGGARVAEGHLEAVLEPDEARRRPGVGAVGRAAGDPARSTRDGAAGEDGDVAQVRHG